MGPTIIYYLVNIMDNDFKLDRRGLNEFVHPGHKGSMLQLRNRCLDNKFFQSMFRFYHHNPMIHLPL